MTARTGNSGGKEEISFISNIYFNMEYPDSRKRPFDGDTESGDTKRSNQGNGEF